ncbi:DUF5808 domain-containing protein [Luteolibacter soli]|uniref:DUF5808 domain-containing protein n=1 Tax=Luteolibacter soli TaxID=3135280 RepID=A0ABU9AXN4_9BACT
MKARLNAMKLSDLERIHDSPESWVLGVIYFSRRDPRLVVRKRIGSLGWTLNFARPLAIPFLLGTLGFIWVSLATLAELDVSKSVKWVVTSVVLFVTLAIWAWVARSGRPVDP